MADFTAVTSVRIEHPDRMENVLAITGYMLDVMGIDQIILVEHDTRPKLMHVIDERIRYLFVQDQGEMWNRSRVFNTALPWITTGVTGIWDCDVIVPTHILQTAINAFDNEGLVGLTPYDRMYFVHRHFLKDVQNKQFDFNIVKDEANYQHMWQGHGGAGIYMVRTDWLRHVRGPSELFWNWGCDDQEIFTRITRLLPGRAAAMPGPLIHINHHRVETVRNISELMIAERHRIRTWSPEEIRAYYGITEELAPYLTRTHPKPAETEDEKRAVEQEMAQHLRCARMDS